MPATGRLPEAPSTKQMDVITQVGNHDRHRTPRDNRGCPRPKILYPIGKDCDAMLPQAVRASRTQQPNSLVGSSGARRTAVLATTYVYRRQHPSIARDVSILETQARAPTIEIDIEIDI
eukprot:jgi/Psemu1/39561/gm1.39561_g